MRIDGRDEDEIIAAAWYRFDEEAPDYVIFNVEEITED